MKQYPGRYLLAAAAATVMAIASVNAQWAPPDADDVSVQIQSYDLKPIRFDDTYPDLEGFSKSNRETWLRLLVEYSVDLIPDRRRKYQDPGNLWLNNLEFNWTVILAPISQGGVYDDRRAVRLTKTVTYTNVKLGKRKYYAMVFVDSKTLLRYAEKISSDDIMVQLSVRIDRKTQLEMAAKGKKYGTTARDRASFTGRGRRGDIFSSEDIVRPAFGLHNRLESPWAWASADSFEQIVPGLPSVP
jgi:hypothetical protein